VRVTHVRLAFGASLGSLDHYERTLTTFPDAHSPPTLPNPARVRADVCSRS